MTYDMIKYVSKYNISYVCTIFQIKDIKTVNLLYMDEFNYV